MLTTPDREYATELLPVEWTAVARSIRISLES
jgi:hypothetical protein